MGTCGDILPGSLRLRTRPRGNVHSNQDQSLLFESEAAARLSALRRGGRPVVLREMRDIVQRSPSVCGALLRRRASTTAQRVSRAGLQRVLDLVSEGALLCPHICCVRMSQFSSEFLSHTSSRTSQTMSPNVAIFWDYGDVHHPLRPG